MESKRQKKFARLIQKDLGEIFQRNSYELFGGTLVTVTQVMMSPDLKLAKVYLNFILVDNPATFIKKVNVQVKHIRQLLANRIGKQAKVIPELRFYLDDTEEMANKVDALFENLNIPPSEDDESQE